MKFSPQYYNTMELKIKTGIRGQRWAAYPPYMIDLALQNPLTADLVVQSMGYFPCAEYHFVESFYGDDGYILLYCHKGSGFCMQEGKYNEMRERQFYVLSARQAYQYGSSKAHPWYLYMVHFCGTKADYIYERIKGHHDIASLSDSRLSDRTAIFDELLNLMEAPLDDCNMAYVNLCFNQLIASFLFINPYCEAKYPQKRPENSTFLSQALQLMHSHIEDRLTITDMAQAMGYSDSYFYRLFYRQMKQAPMAYYMNLKLELACDLLRNTCLQINQVAFKTGFEDSYYFSRFFKKHTQLSPRQYQEQHRKEVGV